MELKTTRHTPVWFSITFVLLAFSIFSWGLGYKLSLYHQAPSTLHSAPTAKLLAGDEQNTSDHAILSFDLSGLPPTEGELAEMLLLPFAAFCISTWLTVKQWELDTAGTSLVRRRAALHSFFFRPPPQIHA